MYKIHVFSYSKRQGTKAANMKEQVLPEIKEKRSKKIQELSSEFQNEYNKSFIGKEMEVLVEEEVNGMFIGHTANYMRVLIKECNVDIRNKVVNVKVNSVSEESLIGMVQ